MVLHKTLCFLRLYYFLAQSIYSWTIKSKKILNLWFLKLINYPIHFLCFCVHPFNIYYQCILTKTLRTKYSLFLNITDPRWYVSEFNNENDNFWVSQYGVWLARIKNSNSECKFRKITKGEYRNKSRGGPKYARHFFCHPPRASIGGRGG